MATFTSSPVASPTPATSVDLAGDLLNAQKIQQNALANQTTQQDLADRATFRANAGGLTQRDPTATAQALGANPTAALSFLQNIPFQDQNTRNQFASDMAASGSLAGSIILAPPEQRASLWAQGRQQLIAGGHKNVPPESYPGDAAMLTMRGLALTAQEQLDRQGQVPTTTPQNPLTAVPGGGSVGPGGVIQSYGPSGSPSGASASGASAAPAGGPPGLAQGESGGNPGAVNPQGFVGKYQFGTGRLADLGLYQPARGENPNSNSWAGQLTIPGFPQVKTLADFLATPAAQDAAYSDHVTDIDHQIASTPGAQNFDQNGLVAVAHLGGVAGMKQFVATGGRHHPADSNGTSLVNYYQRYSSNPPPVQVASNTGAAGTQPTATDASPSPSDAGFQTMRAGLYAPPAPLLSGQPAPPVAGDVSPPAAPSQPPGAAALPRSIASTPNSSQYAAANAPGSQPPNPLAVGLPSAPQTAPPPNALALAPPVGQSPSGGQPAWNALAGPPPSVGQPGQPVAPVSGGFQPLYQNGRLIPIAGQDGWVLGQNAQGQRGAVRLPGAPGAGVDVQNVAGHQYVTDKQTGQLLADRPIADAQRVTVADDGNTLHIMQGSNEISSLPKAPNTPAIQTAQYTEDREDLRPILQSGQQAQQAQIRTRDMRDAFAQNVSGAGADTKLALANWATSMLPDGAAKSFIQRATGMTDVAAAQEAAKLGLVNAGNQERGTLGAHGSLGAIQLYSQANPNINLQPDAIKRISNMQLVAQQADADYALGAAQHVNGQGQGLSSGKGYAPLSVFDQQWQASRPAQAYSGAMGLLNGDPWEKWSKNLSPDEVQRAVGIATRADPGAPVIGKDGKAYNLPSGAPIAGGAGGQPAPASTPTAPTATGPGGRRLILRNGAWSPL